jgi:uncharacterized protein (DUF2062 family)
MLSFILNIQDANTAIENIHCSPGRAGINSVTQTPPKNAALTSGRGIIDLDCILQGVIMIKQHYRKFENSKAIAKLSKYLNATQLWEFNPSAVQKGIALGVACSWIPMPFHTTIAVLLAVLIDCNVLMVITSIWVANPLTMPFMYYSAYRLGAYLMHIDLGDLQFHLSIKDMLHDLHEIWQPFLLGCMILGVASGTIVYLVSRFVWPKVKRRVRRKS